MLYWRRLHTERLRSAFVSLCGLSVSSFAFAGVFYKLNARVVSDGIEKLVVQLGDISLR